MRQWFLISASDGRGEIEKQALLSPQFYRETAACPFVPGMCEEGNPSQHPSSKGQIFILLFLFYVHRPFPGNSTRILISMLLLLLSCFSCVRLLATPWTAAHQAPPSMGFSRQEYWSGVPLLSHIYTVHYSSNGAQYMPYIHLSGNKTALKRLSNGHREIGSLAFGGRAMFAQGPSEVCGSRTTLCVITDMVTPSISSCAP